MAGELAAQATAREMGQLPFLANVRLPQVSVRDAVDPFPETAPLGARVEVIEVRPDGLERAGDRFADPARPVDPVGDAQYLVVHDVGPGGIRRDRVELADRVGPTGQPERERGHVELAGIPVHPEAELQDRIDGHRRLGESRLRDPSDEVGIELLVAGRDRRVDGEDAVPTNGRPGLGDVRSGGHVFASALGEEEG